MALFVPRTCHEINENSSEAEAERPSCGLEDFRDDAAYVLLGPAGSGKTDAFEHEAECTGAGYVTARDFLTFDDKPEWHDTTLFIDGLDEKRAGSPDGGTPLDSIRAKLHRLGRPKFRISCREADWFGANDKDRLADVSSNGGIRILRLDPLSGNDIEKMLRCQPGVSDEAEFVKSARARGIDGLLAYPQSLLMLAKAVAGNVWPETRTQTFEMACATLIREHNVEHRLVESSQLDVTRLIEAAGRLCALQLLSGSAGYSLPVGEENQDYPALDRIPGADRTLYVQVLGTKLFNSPIQGRCEPMHRQVAEYLAAKYLASLSDGGLPAERILAMMAGHDGTPVSELRGLAAWLAAHSIDSRSTIVERDALGVVLYGDVADFSAEEKRQILSCLESDTKDYPWLILTLQSDLRLGDLVDSDLDGYFRQIFADPARDDCRQSFVCILMEMLIYGQDLPDIADLMMDILRDASWWPRVRFAAMKVFLRCHRAADDCLNDLERLLEDIESGLVSDPEDELLGDLLGELYPARLSPSSVLRYLRSPKHSSLLGRYYLFWTHVLLERSTTDDLIELLDNITEQSERMRLEFKSGGQGFSPLRSLPIKALNRLLELSFKDPTADRLFDWLRLASDPMIGDSVTDAKFIRNWLSERPELQKQIIAFGAERCGDSANFLQCMHGVEERLFRANRPSDFGDWCLDQAIKASNPEVADYFIREVAIWVRSNRTIGEPPSEEVLRRLAEHPSLKANLEKFITRFIQSEGGQERSREQREAAKRSRRQEWHDHVKPHESALQRNRCPPALLHKLAQAYLGQFVDVRGETPRDRLRELLGSDESLIDAVLQGFRGSLQRRDLPSPTEITRLGTLDRIHTLAFPFVAGLEELFNAKLENGVGITGKQMQTALAIYFTLPMPDIDAEWIAHSLGSNPDLFADALIHSTRAKIRAGRDFDGDVYNLAHSPDHAEVARLAALPLLESFPLRCRERQLPSLRILLHAALVHCDGESVRRTIDRKLGNVSMNVAQRVYWLSAGVFLSSEGYLEKLKAFVTGKERRIRRLSVALTGRGGLARELIERLDVDALKSLTRCLGLSFRPYSLRASSRSASVVTPGMTVADQIVVFIDWLAHDPSRESADAIDELAADNGLSAWQSQLLNAAYNQNLLRREAEFRHCSIDRALKTLDNLKPANAADLAALTLDRLQGISNRIAHGNTSNWRQYWNVGSYRVEKPRPEDDCRERLLSDLQEKFRSLGIAAEAEGRYADRKRADIRVSFNGFNVPIEIKKSCHRDLWSAVRTQLMEKYARDSDANGYGIYLVFWFGNTEYCRPTPGPGKPVKTASELEDRLADGLSEEEKRKISILVIDVAER